MTNTESAYNGEFTSLSGNTLLLHPEGASSSLGVRGSDPEASRDEGAILPVFSRRTSSYSDACSLDLSSVDAGSGPLSQRLLAHLQETSSFGGRGSYKAKGAIPFAREIQQGVQNSITPEETGKLEPPPLRQSQSIYCSQDATTNLPSNKPPRLRRNESKQMVRSRSTGMDIDALNPQSPRSLKAKMRSLLCMKVWTTETCKACHGKNDAPEICVISKNVDNRNSPDSVLNISESPNFSPSSPRFYRSHSLVYRRQPNSNAVDTSSPDQAGEMLKDLRSLRRGYPQSCSLVETSQVDGEVTRLMTRSYSIQQEQNLEKKSHHNSSFRELLMSMKRCWCEGQTADQTQNSSLGTVSDLQRPTNNLSGELERIRYSYEDSCYVLSFSELEDEELPATSSRHSLAEELECTSETESAFSPISSVFVFRGSAAIPLGLPPSAMKPIDQCSARPMSSMKLTREFSRHVHFLLDDSSKPTSSNSSLSPSPRNYVLAQDGRPYLTRQRSRRFASTEMGEANVRGFHSSKIEGDMEDAKRQAERCAFVRSSCCAAVQGSNTRAHNFKSAIFRRHLCLPLMRPNTE